MSPNTAEAMITGPIASPSRPSVRLTALDAPTITRMAKTTKPTTLSGNSTSFRNGKASMYRNGAGEAWPINQAATPATTTESASLSLAGTPLGLRLVTLRKSSQKPTAPNVRVTPSTIQT